MLGPLNFSRRFGVAGRLAKGVLSGIALRLANAVPSICDQSEYFSIFSELFCLNKDTYLYN
jgi:hypothetical protein